MTLQLDLSPSEAQELQTSAVRDGVPIDQMARRLFTAALRQQKTFEQLHARASANFADSGVTEDEVYAYGEQRVKRVRAEMSRDETS